MLNVRKHVPVLLIGFVMLAVIPILSATASPNGSDCSWAIQYGKEFWRPGSQRNAQPSSSMLGDQPNTSGLNLGEVVDRVSHAFVTEDKKDAPQVKSKSYTAELDSAGLRFVPGNS